MPLHYLIPFLEMLRHSMPRLRLNKQRPLNKVAHRSNPTPKLRTIRNYFKHGNNYYYHLYSHDSCITQTSEFSLQNQRKTFYFQEFFFSNWHFMFFAIDYKLKSCNFCRRKSFEFFARWKKFSRDFYLIFVYSRLIKMKETGSKRKKIVDQCKMY